MTQLHRAFGPGSQPGSCYAQSGKNLPSTTHRLALQRQSSLQTRPNQTKPNLFIQHLRRRPPFSFPSQSSPTSSNPRESLLHHPLRLPIPPLPSFDQDPSSTIIWIAYIKTNSIALDVLVPSWSINRINHPRVVSQAQPVADFTLPTAGVPRSLRLS